MIAPDFERLSNTYSAHGVFLKVDVDKCDDIAAREGVRAMPTFKFFRNRVQLAVVQGANRAGLESKIQELIASVPRPPPSVPEPPRYAPMWHQGNNIGAAIGKAKSANKLFMVFIDDDSDQAKKSAEVIESSAEIITSLTIPLRLKSNEPNARHFGQIYPLLVVPSIFLIGVDGVPVEIIAGDISVDSLREKLEKANDVHKERVASSSASAKPSAVTEEPKSGDVKVKESSVETGVSAKPASSSSSPPPPLDDRLDIARQKLEELQAKKIREAEEKEKLDEIARRETGKAMLEAKKLREDAERREAAASRDKEKRDDAIARQRVLDQIAQDRADRKAREDRDRAIAAGQPVTDSKPSTSGSSKQPEPVNCNQARIQFRMSDGSTLNQTFEATANLTEAHNYLVQKAGLRKFTLSTTFPRRNFGDEDYSRSFRELELLPSAVLLVISNSTSDKVVATGSNIMTAFFMTLVAPLYIIWNYISGFFGGAGSASSGAGSALGGQARGGGQTSGRSSGNDGQASGSNPRKRPAAAAPARQGNIARLRQNENDDDENNTWNGNSTQQM